MDTGSATGVLARLAASSSLRQHTHTHTPADSPLRLPRSFTPIHRTTTRPALKTHSRGIGQQSREASGGVQLFTSQLDSSLAATPAPPP
ncbi:hypothetical protein E2C01_025261 [Portunus trituberculatus]|uniref:Uncharacterized protein n=1 Tax=Portunus trituberculatus TaxID=210409 RepID=A0A5B7ECH9_PORTR|nr:hypothetical protein [Portunus trituberculatus]